MLDRGDLLSLVSYAEAKVLDDGLDDKLGAIEVDEILKILDTMGKLDW